MKTLIICLLGLFFASEVMGQEATSALTKIKQEGIERSKAREILFELSDKFGQRLTGSHEYYKAAAWTKGKLEEWKLDNVHFEEYCAHCRGWTLKTFNVEMTSPYYQKISAYPLAGSKSTKGEISAPLVHMESSTDMEAVKREYSGKLKGKIVVVGKPVTRVSLEVPLIKRLTEEELKKMKELQAPKLNAPPIPEQIKSFESDRADSTFLRFLEVEGAEALLVSMSWVSTILHVQGTYYYLQKHLTPLPYFTVSIEDLNKLARLVELNRQPVLTINLQTEHYVEPKNNVNIIAEIAGTDPRLKAETVMMGAHFDSWHAGSGATDNGAGAAVIMEAMRLLKATGLKPRRTIRMALWGGEEQAFEGSVSYATRHFGKFGLQKYPEAEKVSAYLNIDNGAGVMRGVYLQGNANARATFEEILKPMQDSTEFTVTIDNTFGTDHEVFDYFNIPSFQIIQDPIGYFAVTHHTTLDHVDFVPEKDLRTNAILMAAMAYQLAMREAKVPRK